MQKIFHGITHLPGILQDLGCTRLFLVIDASYPFLNIKDSIESLPMTEKVKFSDFSSNPVYEDVCKGIDLYNSSDCEAILAVGGGSAIDVAKCIKLAVLAEEGNKAIIPPLVSRKLTIDGGRIPLIAIPTTAGTGSESTHNAVMYYEGAKQTVTNDGILPDFAVLEPTVLKTLPLYQKKCTMMDALCQGIESWWSVNSTDESKGYSRKAVELIIAHWKKYIFENDDEAADQIMLAANYGGRAINLAQTTAAHAMSYKITSMYKLPHGHAVAVCLPAIWEFMTKNPDHIADKRGSLYLLRVFDDIAHSMGSNSPEEAIETFLGMMKDLGLQKPVSSRWDKDRLVLSTSVNPIRMRNNPIGLDESTISDLYDRIVSRKDEEVLVSIRCAVFNHEPYLHQCLDGFVMQKTNFRFEAIIHDDVSSDNSVGIIREYAEKYPDIIKPIYETENQYSKNDGSISRIMTAACHGKYFASCEGDDYWTDPLKLQKQVDYLESHPECMLCFTNARVRWEDGSGRPDKLFAPKLEERDYQSHELTEEWITPTASFVYRRSVLESDFYQQVINHPKLKIVGDIPLVLTCAHLGTVHALADATCVYRRQPQGFMLSSDSTRKLAHGDYRYALFQVFGKEHLDSSVTKAIYHYRIGLFNARKEKNWSNWFKLMGRILYVYLRHPICAGKRILKIFQEKKERLAQG